MLVQALHIIDTDTSEIAAMRFDLFDNSTSPEPSSSVLIEPTVTSDFFPYTCTFNVNAIQEQVQLS